MQLVPQAGRIAKISYSMIAFYALAAVTLAPDIIFLAFGVDTNPATWSLLQLLVIAGGVVGRLIVQEPGGALMRRLVIVVVALLFIVLAAPTWAMGLWPDKSETVTETVETPPAVDEWSRVEPHMNPLVRQWEGSHPCPDAPDQHCSYLDRIAAPPVWTVCFGHTETAGPGQRFTEEHCTALLSRDIRQYWAGWRGAVTVDPAAVTQAAFGSLAYNIGVSAARNSTATRRLNARDLAGACEALTWWNKAGGRVVRGLVNRRSAEFDKCMLGHV